MQQYFDLHCDLLSNHALLKHLVIFLTFGIGPDRLKYSFLASLTAPKPDQEVRWAAELAKESNRKWPLLLPTAPNTSHLLTNSCEPVTATGANWRQLAWLLHSSFTCFRVLAALPCVSCHRQKNQLWCNIPQCWREVVARESCLVVVLMVSSGKCTKTLSNQLLAYLCSYILVCM